MGAARGASFLASGALGSSHYAHGAFGRSEPTENSDGDLKRHSTSAVICGVSTGAVTVGFSDALTAIASGDRRWLAAPCLSTARSTAWERTSLTLAVDQRSE